jgi:eukaryotic-like serine/threonine-protein kinase
MASTGPCPDDQALLRFALGLGSEEEAEPWERHLAGCPNCLARLSKLRAEDQFVEALHAQAEGTEPADPAVATLMRRLGNLPAPAGLASAATLPPSDSLDAEVLRVLGPAQAPDEIGRLGSYRVLRVLGSGGMGVVFEAEDVMLRRRVALKTMKPGLAATASARQRFLREARAMAALSHDHVVPVLHVGEERDLPFVVMPLLEGATLEERLQREEPLPIGEVLRIGKEVAVGLAAAHERGLVHRDVKPANVWLEAGTGRVKILDFGLARATAQAAGQTSTGVVLGTPSYMAPEQAQGQPVDPRCDLFSLGCVLYRMTTGQVPFTGADSFATLMAVVGHQPPPPVRLAPALPPRLSDLIMRLLAKRPAARPASAQAVADALDAIAREPARQAPRWPWLLGGVLLVAVLAAVGYAAFRPGPGRGGPPGNTAVATRPDTRPRPKAAPPGEVGRFEGHTDAVRCVAFLPDGKHALSGGDDRVVRLWEVDTFQEVRQLKGHVAAVQCLAVSTDGKRALSAGGANPVPKDDPAKLRFDVFLWDLDLGKDINRFTGHADIVSGVAFSPDGRRFFTASWDTSIRTWRTNDPGNPGTAVTEFAWPAKLSPAPLRALALSADGNKVAVSTGEGVVWRWSPVGNPSTWLLGSGVSADALAWIAADRLLVGAADGTVTERDADTGEVFRTFKGNTERVWSVAVSPDGRRVLSGGVDRTVRLWDRDSGELLAELTGHTKGVQWVTFSPDGKRALSAGGDKTVRLWQLP